MTPTDRRPSRNPALRDYAEGAFGAVLVALILTAVVLGGPVTGTMTAVLVALFVISPFCPPEAARTGRFHRTERLTSPPR